MPQAVDTALDFFLAANTPALRQDGQELPLASEACFSIAAHLAKVRRRLGRLNGIEAAAAVDRDAATFVRERVLGFWQRLETRILSEAGRLGLDPDTQVTPAMRCLSPSDFGFHNALREPSGRLRFIDFEYAGWDDPAKLVGDFFNQVQAPVPPIFFIGFAQRVAALFPEPERNFARFEMLLPVYAGQMDHHHAQ